MEEFRKSALPFKDRLISNIKKNGNENKTSKLNRETQDSGNELNDNKFLISALSQSYRASEFLLNKGVKKEYIQEIKKVA